MNLEQIAKNYALAYEALQRAKRDFREACAAMHKPHERVPAETVRRFDSPETSVGNEGAEDGLWYYAGTNKPVDDPADLEIIDRWIAAHAAQVAAARKLGAYKAAILRAGRILVAVDK